MALPKKGIRKITIDDEKYYWTVKYDYYWMALIVRVGLVKTPNKSFFFAVKRNDPWLFFREEVNNGKGGITPKLVRDSIEFANSNTDWKENPHYGFEYLNGVFSIA